MAWFKVDDGFHASDKLNSIPKRHKLAAAGLWVIAGSWAANQLTDGRVPDYMLQQWGATPAVVQCLLNAGLWEHEQGSNVFYKWHEYQPSKHDVDAERAASRARMKEIRARRKQPKPQKDAEEQEVFGRTVTNGSENVRNPDPTRPDPTRPDPPIEVLNAHPADAPQKGPSVQQLNEMFDTFWMEWPVKKGKEPARKSFQKAIKGGAGMADILAGVARYKAELGPLVAGKTATGGTPKYAQGWLTDQRWTDEPDPTATPAYQQAGYEIECALGRHRWMDDNTCLHCPERRDF